MNERDFWRAVALAGWVFGAATAYHGVTSRRWRQFHALGLLLSTAAIIGPKLRAEFG